MIRRCICFTLALAAMACTRSPVIAPAGDAEVLLGPRDLGDLERIKARGVLRVLLPPVEEQFLPRLGMPATQDEHLLTRLSAQLGVRLKLIPVRDRGRLLDLLVAGRADIVAAQLTVTQQRKARVAFTHPIASVDELVVGRKGAETPPKNAAELAGRQLHVRASSSYAQTVERIRVQDGIDVTLAAVPEQLSAEEIAWQVSQGQRPLTIIDSHLLDAIETYNHELHRAFTITQGRQIAWAVRKDNPELLAATNALLIEHNLTGHTRERFVGDLEGIRERGVLRVLTRNNPVTYFLHKGRQMGFDYELSRLAAAKLGLRLEIVVPPSRDLLVPWLLEGRGDIIAASMTITQDRQQLVSFSKPYLFVDEVVVEASNTPIPLAGLEDLEGRQIHVRPSSSYYQTLLELMPIYGPYEIVSAPEDVETEDLIAAVASAKIPLTVSDSHILDVELTYRNDIRAAFALRSPPRSAAPEPSASGPREPAKKIAFAVRKTSPELRAFLDGFVDRTYRGLEYNIARRRYFENKRHIVTAKENRSGASGAISGFDDLFKKYSKQYGLDWRLIAAQAYQESRFDPTATSWAGARGLFQVMPATGKELGFANLFDPDNSTHAGVKYMHYLLGRFEPELDFKQRIRFALAAYNAGYGHVQDARRLASLMGWDRNRWFAHTDKAMRLLQQPQYYARARHGYCRGSEPVRYVSEIQSRYDNYVGLFSP